MKNYSAVMSTKSSNLVYDGSKPGDAGIRRSQRKRKVKQFSDYEVDLPQNDRDDQLDEVEADHDETPRKVRRKTHVELEPAVNITDSDSVCIDEKEKFSKRSSRDLSGSSIRLKDKLPTNKQTRGSATKTIQVKSEIDEWNDSDTNEYTNHKEWKTLYKCLTNECSKSFPTFKNLDVHKREEHGEDTLHLCKECGKTFRSFTSYRSHIRMEHSLNKTVQLVLRNVDLVKENDESVGVEVLVCTYCGYRYNKENSSVHDCVPMELHYYCPCCDFNSVADLDMQQHLSENHKGEYFQKKDTTRYGELRSAATEPSSRIGKNRSKCEICNIKLETEEDLKQHMNSRHADHPFACGVCKACYGRKTALKKHMMVHKKADLRCTVCNKGFYQKARLDVHMLTHSGERPHVCEICGNRYCDEGAVRKHIALKHSKYSNEIPTTWHMCHLCGKLLQSAHTLNRHLRSHNRKTEGTEIHNCPHCELTFNDLYAMRQHKLIHETLDFSQTGGVKSISNQTMNEVFKEIQTQDEGHPSGLPYQCSICKKRFSQQKFVNRHIRLVHMKQEDKKFVCHICKRGFTLGAALRTHMRLHMNTKPYKCRICQKQFRQLGHIKSHLLHHGKPQWKCALCNRMLQSRASLKRHVTIHCKTFPFKCPVKDCKAAFLTLFPFLTHLAKCLGDVNDDTMLKCNFCEKTFSKKSISSHYHTHENDATFPCKTCGMIFAKYQLLYFHKESKNHFVQSEFESPSNNNIINRHNIQEYFEGDEDLMSQYDYIEEEDDPGDVTVPLLQEDKDVDVYEEPTNVVHENIDDDGELILIAEQLTYMASGIPCREVIVQTTDTDLDGTVTEITIEEANDDQQEDQNETLQNFGEVIDRENNDQYNINTPKSKDIENLPEQICVGQIDVGQTNELVDADHEIDQVNAKQKLEVASTGQGTSDTIDEEDTEQAETVQGDQEGLNNTNNQAIVDNTAEGNNELEDGNQNVEQLHEGMNKSDELVDNTDVLPTLNDHNVKLTEKHSQEETVPVIKGEIKLCSFCKRLFPNETELSEHKCKYSSCESKTRTGYITVKNRKNKRKTHRKLKDNIYDRRSSMAANDMSHKLKNLFKRMSIEYQCTSKSCSKIAYSVVDLSKHRKSVHREVLKYVCKQCDKQFGSFFIFKSHIRMEHSDQDSVVLQLRNTNLVVKVKNNIVGKEVLVCTRCGYRYGDLELPDHDCKPVGLCYYCPCCEYSSSNLMEMGDHIAANHEGECKALSDNDKYACMRSMNREPGWRVSEIATNCDDCKINFETNDELKHHLNTKHASRPFACGFCQICYGRKAALMKHFLSHTSITLKCEICNKEFNQKSALDSHKTVHSGVKPFQCEVCGNRYFDKKSIRAHLMMKHVDHFKANYPNSAVNTRAKKKMKSPAICHLCGKYFLSDSKLRKHMKEHEEEPTRMFKCPYCDLTFSNTMTFKRHKQAHQVLDLPTDESGGPVGDVKMNEVLHKFKDFEEGHPSGLPYKCNICEKRFRQHRFVARHIRVIHLREEDKTFICSICSRGFTLSAALRTHMRLHTNTKPYKCRLCDKQFRQLGHIKDHLLHHGKPRLKCVLCNKMFKSKSNLRRHVDTHCKIRPFKCPKKGCSAAFQALFPFLTHCSTCLESVNPEELLECKICKKHFVASEIISHSHCHENDLNFPCNLCDMSFVSYRQLFRHKDQKSHFTEEEFESPGNGPNVKKKDIADSDIKIELSSEELLMQYDYIGEEDHAVTKQEKKGTAEIHEKQEKEVIEEAIAEAVIANNGEIVLTADQLSEITSGTTSGEVVVQIGQTDETNVTEIALEGVTVGAEEGAITYSEVDSTQDLLKSLGVNDGNAEVYSITKPETGEVTYYILKLDQEQT